MYLLCYSSKCYSLFDVARKPNLNVYLGRDRDQYFQLKLSPQPKLFLVNLALDLYKHRNRQVEFVFCL